MRITGYKHSEDFDRLIQINEACYSGIYLPPRDLMADYASVSDVFIARVDGELENLYINGEKSSKDYIIGFAIVRNAVNPYIWNIAVDPAYQNRGVAGNMLREIIKRYTLEKCKQITLHVNANNAAQKLYYDYGFRVVAVEEEYFTPDDGLLMERPL
jgi:ribosomal protein S18 acetylase RimI-like enzyme